MRKDHASSCFLSEGNLDRTVEPCSLDPDGRDSLGRKESVCGIVFQVIGPQGHPLIVGGAFKEFNYSHLINH